ncbi:MAG: response regulator transcription factor [Cyclobacteriaceae bacterium]
MAKILVVEDEMHMRIGLKDNLEFESFEVDLAEDGQRGLELLGKSTYDLILLDVMMPKMSGFEVCKQARKAGVTTPIIFLTAKGEEIDKVLGLELGADDYITKPFSLRELVARVKAVLRRTGNDPEEVTIKKALVGKLDIDFQHYEAKVGGESVKMSHKEFETLHYLLVHKNEVVSRYQLLEDVWGYESQPTTRTIDNFILKLRQKIEDNPNDPKIILTVHGVGYKLID